MYGRALRVFLYLYHHRTVPRYPPHVQNHQPQAMQAAFGVPAVLSAPGEKAQQRVLDQEADDMLRFVSLWKSSGAWTRVVVVAWKWVCLSACTWVTCACACEKRAALFRLLLLPFLCD